MENNLECVVCYKPANIIYGGTTFCGNHFELLWTFETGPKRIGDEKNHGKSLYQMKNPIKEPEAGPQE